MGCLLKGSPRHKLCQKSCLLYMSEERPYENTPNYKKYGTGVVGKRRPIYSLYSKDKEVKARL